MNARAGKLMVQVLFLLLLTDLALSEANNRTPARILAKQTGAAQFEEHIEQPQHYDCNEHHHRLRKRSSDEDLDYEVYQGVVGRPGIDFPIFPRIPQTTFSCRSYGNGYFADLETGCQVFHICEEGRKISFLCPNGTIFQQSELTCDWWFKVNCAGSPSFYAESAEILHKARKRVKTNPVHKGFTNTNKVAELIPTGKPFKGSERRIDSNENPSVESLDFDDISDDRSNDRSSDRAIVKSSSRSGRPNSRNPSRSSDKLKLQKERLLTNPPPDSHSHNEHELQITAETGSFVKNPRRNSYTGADKTLNKEREFISDKPLDKSRDLQTPRVQSIVKSNQRNDFNTKQKTGKKIDDSKPAGFYITSRPDATPPSAGGKGSYYTTAQPDLYTNRNSLNDGEKQFVTPEPENRNVHDTYSTLKPDFFGNAPIVKGPTTPSAYPGTYSTARRLDSTRTTPFYTPTVPSVPRSKPTESKTFVINVQKGDEPTDNAKPVIGLRQPNSEIHRFPVFSNGDLRVQLPVLNVEAPKLGGPSLTTSTSGPTYLPKGTDRNKNQPITPANVDNSLSRNVNGILQTVGVIKETMKTNFDDKPISSRVGLDIPPSSGPGTLLSLTNYFADDDQTSTTLDSDDEKSTTPSVDIAAGLLSNKTSGKYFSLFGLANNNTQKDEDDQLLSATTAAPRIANIPTAVGDFTRTTIRDLAQNPETRKIAQVFSNAITKYIENPETFRQDLIGVRPTEPSLKPSSVTESPNTTPNNYRGGTVTVSILTDTPYISTTTEKYDATTTDSNDIAKEINNQFDVSTPAYDSVSTESTEATTYRGSSFSTTRPKLYHDTGLSAELLPPSHDEERDHESLHKVQSQSFVKSFNDLAKSPKAIDFSKSRNAFDTSAEKGTTPGYPWSQSKNDRIGLTDKPWVHDETTTDRALTTTTLSGTDSTTYSDDTNSQEQDKARYTSTAGVTTDSPWSRDSSAEKLTTTGSPWLQKVKPTENPWSQITHSIYLDPLTINDGLMHDPAVITTTSAPFAYVNTDRSRFEDASEDEEGVDDILNSPELSSELLPKNNGLQRIANKIFGGLNETEALHLKNVMKKAEHNQSVLRLLLLLIQTCDDQNGKALERSRKLLLNALIGMDGKLKSKTSAQVTATTTNKVPVTTYRRVFSDITTTVKSPTTTDMSSSSDETTKFEIRVPDLDDDVDGNTVNASTSKAVSSSESKGYDNPNRTSDQRALELLKSLYALASKFSRR